MPSPADFGGTCLVGRCAFDAALLLPASSYLGTRKEGSYLYGTWRDADGNLLRAIRGVIGDTSPMRFVFEARGDGQLERNQRAEDGLWQGAVTIDADGQDVRFVSAGSELGEHFEFREGPTGCEWTDGSAIEVTGRPCGPALQWFSTFDAGACFSVSAKYRSTGRFLGRAVEGFVGHEIHYFTPGSNWLESPFGRGREICWQQVANEYDDGSMTLATFSIGTDGWGFAIVHDDRDGFRATTLLEAEATVRPNGTPDSITYRFLDESWTWRIDPQGERAPIMPGSPLIGVDGTCTRDGDDRVVRVSMGNSDWWLDGRADAIVRR